MSERMNARVFVVTADEWTSPTVKSWMQYFGIQHAGDIYGLYRDKSYIARLSFDDRKRFLSLLGQFVTPLRWRLVPRVCGNVDLQSTNVLRAQNDDDYHLDTGFGHLLVNNQNFDTYELNLESTMSRSHNLFTL
jgi:hypothetical protein